MELDESGQKVQTSRDVLYTMINILTLLYVIYES